MIKKLCPIFTVLVILLSIVQTRPLIYNVEAELPQQEQITKPSETTQESEPTVEETYFIQTEPTTPTEIETESKPVYSNYYGRLIIPDVGIDVALYSGAQQYITDRQDSANIFAMSVFNGLYISDHKSQEFGKLLNVQVGMRGYLHTASGYKLNIVCVDVLDGHNTGRYIVDENGNTNLDGDYLMYTCRSGIYDIRICLWKNC